MASPLAPAIMLTIVFALLKLTVRKKWSWWRVIWPVPITIFACAIGSYLAISKNGESPMSPATVSQMKQQAKTENTKIFSDNMVSGADQSPAELQKSTAVDVQAGYNTAIQNQSSSVSLSESSPSPEPSMPERDSKFAKLRLPLGVSVEVPKNWRIIDGDLNATIQTAAEAALNLSEIELPRHKRVNLFRANSMPQTTYAGIAINATDSEEDPTVLKNASEEEIAALTPNMHEMMQQAMSIQNAEIIEFYEVRRELVGNHPALIIEYKRSDPQGAVIVKMTQLFLGGKIISLNLSYRESEARIWKPIIEYIRKSLTVS
jgi:hypothetical protein